MDSGATKLALTRLIQNSVHRSIKEDYDIIFGLENDRTKNSPKNIPEAITDAISAIIADEIMEPKTQYNYERIMDVIDIMESPNNSPSETPLVIRRNLSVAA